MTSYQTLAIIQPLTGVCPSVLCVSLDLCVSLKHILPAKADFCNLASLRIFKMAQEWFQTVLQIAKMFCT